MGVMDRLFKALGDPVRLDILAHLSRPEAECCSAADRVCACDLEKLTKLSQPCVSHHMKILVETGLVEAERDGRWTFYRIRRGTFARLAQHLDRFAGRDVARGVGTASARRP
jgi:ArsR family transcriptional regulator, arsenate/arsenite/antimonite-responsive transcriptional repressor